MIYLLLRTIRLEELLSTSACLIYFLINDDGLIKAIVVYRNTKRQQKQKPKKKCRSGLLNKTAVCFNLYITFKEKRGVNLVMASQTSNLQGCKTLCSQSVCVLNYFHLKDEPIWGGILLYVDYTLVFLYCQIDVKCNLISIFLPGLDCQCMYNWRVRVRRWDMYRSNK